MNLILFFTYSVSLKTWAETGLIDREILLYKRLVDKGVRVTFITYGNEEDYNYQDKLGNIVIVPYYAYTKKPCQKIIRFFHSFLLPFILHKKIKQADIFKTNQMWGSWVAILSKLLYLKKIIVRCGYENYRLVLCLYKNEFSLYKVFVWLISWIAYKFSDAVILTSKKNKKFVVKTFSVPTSKIILSINYIDTSLFKKINYQKYENKLLFIGRLSKEKNIFQISPNCLYSFYNKTER